MHSRILILMVIAAFVLPSLGCSGDKGEEGSTAGSTEGGALVVTVNGREVYENEIEQEEARIRTQLSGRVPMQQLEGMGEVIKQQAVNNMINRVLLEQAADRAQIEIPETDVKERAGQVGRDGGARSGYGDLRAGSGVWCTGSGGGTGRSAAVAGGSPRAEAVSRGAGHGSGGDGRRMGGFGAGSGRAAP